MKRIRAAAIAFLVLLGLSCALVERLTPAPYGAQFRDLPDAACSRTHPLGTDDLGRDRLSRLLYGTRVSLVLAPAASLLTTVLAALLGGAAGVMGGRIQSCIAALMDLVLSMPWFFLLITVRALLPLNVSPLNSAVITFALLGVLGWAGAGRVVCADARMLRRSDVVLFARAYGSSGLRLLCRQMLPNLKPVLSAQFWICVPVFILTEANLGMLGLGVAEPLPSWGSLLRELGGMCVGPCRPMQFVPLVLLILTVSSFQLAFDDQEARA